MDYLYTLIPLLAGWCLDLIFGDPERLPHPVVGYGKLISACEHRFNHGTGRILKGSLTAIGLILSVYLVTELALRLLSPLPWLKIAVEAVLVFYCLAGTTLVKEVVMVFRALGRSLDDGRRQVARIVGRDTAALSAHEVRTAALETLAENLSDGVIAPLFWYALLGVPGMMAYKMVNTLDSMIGYRNARFKDFGCTTAHIDDAANYIPARLTAFLMVLVSGRPGAFSVVRRFGRCHASPNSGYPESALAGILDCRFGGPHDYFGECVDKPFIGTNSRELTQDDLSLSVAVFRRAETAAVALTALARLIPVWL